MSVYLRILLQNSISGELWMSAYSQKATYQRPLKPLPSTANWIENDENKRTNS